MKTELEDRVQFTMGDYSYFCDGSREEVLCDLLTRLERFAGEYLTLNCSWNTLLVHLSLFKLGNSGKQKPQDWIQLVKEKNFEKLVSASWPWSA